MFSKFFQAITYWPTSLLFWFFLRYEANGQENLERLKNEAIIFVSNHASFIDGPISAASMPRYKRQFYPKDFFPIRFLVAKEYFNWRNSFPFPISILIAAYVRINSIPVIRGSGGDLEQKLSAVIKALKEKNKVWIYPEGKITPDGNIQKGKKGVAFLHQQTGAVIVPVALIGTFGILSFKSFLRTRKVKVKIGKPIHSLSGTLEQMTDKIMEEIGKLNTNDYSPNSD